MIWFAVPTFTPIRCYNVDLAQFWIVDRYTRFARIRECCDVNDTYCIRTALEMIPTFDVDITKGMP
jgi:hypothetical protein